MTKKIKMMFKVGLPIFSVPLVVVPAVTSCSIQDIFNSIEEKFKELLSKLTGGSTIDITKAFEQIKTIITENGGDIEFFMTSSITLVSTGKVSLDDVKEWINRIVEASKVSAEATSQVIKDIRNEMEKLLNEK